MGEDAETAFVKKAKEAIAARAVIAVKAEQIDVREIESLARKATEYTRPKNAPPPTPPKRRKARSLPVPSLLNAFFERIIMV